MNHCLNLVGLIRDELEDVLRLRDSFLKKSDGSFVSKGDLRVQQIVFDYLKANMPEYQLVSEEMAPFDGVSWNEGGSYVILDPIDGTENFISGLKEWGVGLSIYTRGKHTQSCIFLPELSEFHYTGLPLKRYKSRIYGLSSSLNQDDLKNLPSGFEYRIIGCSMYNMLSAIKGAFAKFENVKGVNCWDILPGLNLALEQGCNVWVDGNPYNGELLFPTKKYKVAISNSDTLVAL